MDFVWNGKTLSIDGLLAMQLDTLAYNVDKDWDFVIVITGDRGVRIGKSVFAATICAYLAYTLTKMGLKTKYDLSDVYFDNKDIMKEAPNKPKYSINHYDEGREGLAASKAMTSFQEDLLDFFAECGQLNHIWVIVMPDFFELREQIAVARSEYLINVFRHEEKVMRDIWNDGTKRAVVRFDRGFFEFFNRSLKKTLYDKARSMRRKTYALVKHNFRGTFSNQYPFDEAEYREKKRISLSRFQERKEGDKELRATRGKSGESMEKIVKKLRQTLSVNQIQEFFRDEYGIEYSTRQLYKIGREKDEGGSV